MRAPGAHGGVGGDPGRPLRVSLRPAGGFVPREATETLCDGGGVGIHSTILVRAEHRPLASG